MKRSDWELLAFIAVCLCIIAAVAGGALLFTGVF